MPQTRRVETLEVPRKPRGEVGEIPSLRLRPRHLRQRTAARPGRVLHGPVGGQELRPELELRSQHALRRPGRHALDRVEPVHLFQGGGSGLRVGFTRQIGLVIVEVGVSVGAHDHVHAPLGGLDAAFRTPPRLAHHACDGPVADHLVPSNGGDSALQQPVAYVQREPALERGDVVDAEPRGPSLHFLGGLPLRSRNLVTADVGIACAGGFQHLGPDPVREFEGLG